ncbi:hypothetical protein SALBM311S_01502 [Streptomyces alboniger]
MVPDDATYLISEHGITAIRAPHLEAVVPLLDGSRDHGRRSTGQPRTAARPEPAHRPSRPTRRAGFIEYAREHHCSEPADHSAEAYWELAGLEGQPDPTADRVHHRGAASVGDFDAAYAARALRASGLAVTTDPAPGAALTVVICDDYLAPELAALDAEHRANGRPWLLAKPSGATIWVGPVFRPGTGACGRASPTRYGCTAASSPRSAPPSAAPAGAGPAAGIPCTLGAGLHLAAIEAAKWLAGHHPGQDRVLTSTP